MSWKDVRVGDVIRVEKNKFIPADLMLMASSLFRKGQCYLETKNLDGESNLKSMYIPEGLRGRILDDKDVKPD